jgi:hypothetical protein
MADPRPEDFYARPRVGESALQQFVKGLEINVPTRMPEGLSRASTTENRRGAVSSAARGQRMTVRTMLRGGEIWVLRVA